MSEISIKIARTLSLVGKELSKNTANQKAIIKLLSRLSRDELMLVAATQPGLVGTDLPRTKTAISALLSSHFISIETIRLHHSIAANVNLEGNYSIDRKTINKMAMELKPLFSELRKDLKYLRDVKPTNILTMSGKNNVKKSLYEYHDVFKKQFSGLVGESVSDEQVKAVLDSALSEGFSRVEYALDRKTDLGRIMKHNLQADGIWHRSGPVLAWQTSGGEEFLFDVKRSDTDKAAGLGIMTGLFVLELFGMVMALAGVVLPKIPSGLADDVGREMARPRNRRLLRRLMKILSDVKRSMADKIEAIFNWAKDMFEVGFFGLLFKKLFDGLSGWRIALIIAMMIAQLLAMFLPGVGQALVVKKGATIALGLGTLTGKLWEIADIMEA